MLDVVDFQHRSVTLLNVPAYLAARSIDPIGFLRTTGISASVFSDVNGFIPRELCFLLEHELQRLTGDNIVGGNVANRYHLSELGPWGEMIMAAQTLRDAISFAVNQIHLLQTGFTLDAFCEGHKLVLAYRYEGRSRYHPTQHLLGSAVVIRKIAMLAGFPDAVDVHLQRPYSADLADIDEMLGTRIQFEARYDGVSIDLGIVDHAFPHLNHDVRPHVQTAWDVTAHIRSLLPYKRVTKEYIASLLGTSPRTVQRRLSEWGLTFEQLIDDIRRTEAIRLLEDTQLTISDIAALIGYSDGPHLLRAFRRWTGTTPAYFRQAAKFGRPIALPESSIDKR